MSRLTFLYIVQWLTLFLAVADEQHILVVLKVMLGEVVENRRYKTVWCIGQFVSLSK